MKRNEEAGCAADALPRFLVHMHETMKLRIYKTREYARKAKARLFDETAEAVAALPGGGRAVLIANHAAGGIEADALLITDGGVAAIWLYAYGGIIAATEGGCWTADGKIIACGAIDRNPLAKARRDMRRAHPLIEKWFGKDAGALKAYVIFGDGAVTDGLTPTAKDERITVCSVSELQEKLKEAAAEEIVFTDEEFDRIPEIMQLTDSGTAHTAAADAAAYYAELEEIAAGGTGTHDSRRMLKDLLRRITDDCVADRRVNFVGTFAKLDFLIKENGIPDGAAAMMHAARVALNTAATTGGSGQEEQFMHDVKAVALLVHYACGRQPVPPSLAKLLPEGDRPKAWGAFRDARIRCVVSEWDDEYIYVTDEHDGARLKVCYGSKNTYLTRGGKGDWGYLKGLLAEGAQLNLVRVRFDGDVCMPELIIYEPDYLVNVTTIASCFETYAESPFVSLVNKIKPLPNTPAIHLGNLAGRYLDDTVHGRRTPFDEGITEFFKDNAMALLACDGMADAKQAARFYDDAEVQKRNIDKLIGRDLPALIGGYDPEAVMLEPTFFSEILGIQGRFDFLYEKDGLTVIIEQKSGKGAYVPPTSPAYDPDTPAVQEKHWVQLTLYRALFAYQFGKRAGEMSHAMLLYSRYGNGLVETAQSPRLLLRAVRMRNLIAWCEMSYAESGLRILDGLTPDKLNMKHAAGRLWENYTKPALEAVLAPIREASPLERSYYFRFMQFIEKEQLLAKTGGGNDGGRGFAAVWHDTFDDKLAAGTICAGLTIDPSCNADDGSLRLRFGRTTRPAAADFRRGDIVILYPYAEDGTPDPCAGPVIRAAVADMADDGLELALREAPASRQARALGEGMLWAVEHDMYDSSYSPLYRGMHAFLSADKSRRDLILLRRTPAVDPTVKIKGSYGAFDTLVTRAKQARELFLVVGPPGTGKTSYGLLYQLQEELLEQGTSVLLTACTNRAVDEICGKLAEADVDFVRIGPRLTCGARYRHNLLQARLEGCATADEARAVIEGTRVFCATVAAVNSDSGLLRLKRFSLAIVDEASQLLEPQLAGLLAATTADGSPAVDRFVLIGDHKQLPAVVLQTEDDSHVAEPSLRAAGLTDCRRPLFERQLRAFKTTDGYDPRYVYMLTRQGRMHRDIAAFPNAAFYGGRLTEVPLPHQTQPCRLTAAGADGIARLLCRGRTAFVASPQVDAAAAAAKTNPAEALMMAATAVRIYNLCRIGFNADTTLGIIVPFRAQIAEVRSSIARSGITALRGITIDTVERYQGSQRDYIICGLTVGRPWQMRLLTSGTFEEDGLPVDRKLNVALTRARLGLVVIGNPRLLAEAPAYRALMDFARRHGCYVDVTPEEYCSGNFNVTDDTQLT